MNNHKFIFFNEIMSLFSFDQKINYCLLEPNKDSFYNISSDIDIAVSSISLCKDLIIRNQLKNYRVVQILENSRFSAHIFLTKKIAKRHVIISFDLYEKYCVGNRIIIDFKDILTRKKKIDDYHHISKGDFIYYYFIKSHLKNVLEKKIPKLRKYKNTQINFPSYISDELKNKINNIIKTNSSKYIGLKSILNKNKFFKKRDYLHFLNRFSRIKNPTGFTISFTGPDGVGKSTIIEKLIQSELPFRGIEKFHLKPRLIGKKAKGIPVSNPINEKPYNFLMRIFKSAHVISDYLFGFFIKVFPLKIKSRLIIFDRYVYDLHINPNRFRLKQNSLNGLILKITPRLNLNIFLVANPNTIRNRKNELTLSEIEKQLLKMKKFYNDKNSLIVNTEDNIDSNISLINNKIYSLLNERY